jgi:anthranilate phosphoribosyltransferase
MKAALETLSNSESLTTNQAKEALLKIGSGEVNNVQIAAFLMGIKQKNISVDELIGFKEAMLELAVKIDLSSFDAMDVCGTGGDGKDTFNISTTTAFVVAGAGQPVAKHGNHGMSSPNGSSTVLEHLGVIFSNENSFLNQRLEKANICYLHAPLFHPAMRFVGPVRKELGIKTFFNILGPLLNPARVTKQLTGVFDLKTFDLYEKLFLTSNSNFGIVHSIDGYEEVSLTGGFKFAKRTECQILDPKKLGFNLIKSEELSGGKTLEESAKILVSILKNESTDAQKNVVIINAALAISIAKNISIDDGIMAAKESLISGKALGCFKALVS